MRPKSIVLFERIFLINVVVGIASGIWTSMHWSSLMPAEMPRAVLAIMPIFMAAGVVTTLAVDLLLWFFIARRGADVAKWIFVVLFALGVAGLARSLLGHQQVVLPVAVRIVSAIRLLLNAVCTALLFRPDAVCWFNGDRVPRDLHDTFS